LAKKALALIESLGFFYKLTQKGRSVLALSNF